jgi:hypothetical protein
MTQRCNEVKRKAEEKRFNAEAQRSEHRERGEG